MKTVQECRTVMEEVTLRDACDYYADCPSAFDGGFGDDEAHWVRQIQADALEYAAKLARREDATKTEFLLQMSIKYNELTAPSSDSSNGSSDSKEPPS